jgi:DNA (cytosine-5)-methyltransferase 1
MRYASVCDGIGAAHVAWQPLGWECAWTSEIEPFPAAVVDHHWRLKNLGDMTKLTEEMLDEHGPVDLLAGGTPCQSFSVAGLRGGLADPRGNLALRFVQLVGVLRPSWVVWENVPGVLSSGGGRDFGTFLGALAELGYGFAYRVLDAQWFGVAQRRRRVFVVAHLGDWRRAAAVLFERESVFGNPPTRGTKGETAPTIPARSTAGGGLGTDFDCDGGLISGPITAGIHKGPRGTEAIESNHAVVAFDWQKGNDKTNARPSTMNVAVDQSQTIGSTRVPAVAFTKSKRAQSTTDDETWVPGEVSPTMSCFDQGDTRATTVIACEVADTLSVGANQTTGFFGDAVAINMQGGKGQAGCTRDLRPTLGADTQMHAISRVAVASCEVSSTLRSNPGSGWRSNGTPVEGVVISPMAVRRLTPRECERLQGFPDDYTLVTYRNKPAADGPRYRALGNSMAVPVMAWIGQRIQMVKEATDGTQAR